MHINALVPDFRPAVTNTQRGSRITPEHRKIKQINQINSVVNMYEFSLTII